MARFVCPRCTNTFRSDAELAVCDGMVVKADEEGNPLAEDGSPLEPGGKPVRYPLTDKEGNSLEHPPVVMDRKRR